MLSSPNYPLKHAIAYKDPLSYVEIFKDENHLVFLDSASAHSALGRYSYIALDPFALLIKKNNHVFWNDEVCASHRALEVLTARLSTFTLQTHPDLPPFQGGAAGFLSYDLARELEKLPEIASPDQACPSLALGFYDVVISFDHLKKQAWIVSTGFPELEAAKKAERAQSRLEYFFAKLNTEILSADSLCSLMNKENISYHFSRESYMTAIERCREYIAAGDIFEVNLSQRFDAKLSAAVSPFDLYRRIRKLNPAPFAAYMRFDECAIVSSSPECFLRLEGKCVETRPMKGTIKRVKDAHADQLLKDQLAKSVKDRAENTMIVDLMRNDLSKVCVPGSVQVPHYCQVETYENVHHLVSVVAGVLESHYGAVDLLQAAFPGGSITGAPKIRAMEIIDALEPTRRAAYCGSAGYIGFDGCMNTSILIRTYLLIGNSITFQTGGAVVLDSDPLCEYEETLLKAETLQRALTETVA